MLRLVIVNDVKTMKRPKTNEILITFFIFLTLILSYSQGFSVSPPDNPYGAGRFSVP